jgi:uncharacterized membrane protein
MNETKCVSCQTEIDADAIFCNECGAVQGVAVTSATVGANQPSAAYKTCPKCQKQLMASVNFCSGCAFDFINPPAIEPAADAVCPNCQKTGDRADRFCRHCAFDLTQPAKISSAHFCTACSNPFDAADKFCRHCAADLSKSNHTVAVPVISVSPTVSGALHSIPNFAPADYPVQPLNPSPPIERAGETSKPNGLQWISPSLAGFALICFFMPWVEVSCSAFGSTIAEKSASGADLAQFDGSLWFLPMLASAAILLYFIFKSQNKIEKARPLIAACAGLALFFMLFKALNLENSLRAMPNMSFGTDWKTGLDYDVRFGIWGTILGFIGVLAGVAFLKNDLVSASKHSSFSPALPTRLESGVDTQKAKILGGLFYLVPAFSPILFLLLARKLFYGIGDGIAFFLLFVLTFALQLILLKFSKKTDLFVKYHAAQSICYFGAYLVAGFIVFQIFAALWGAIPLYRVLGAVFFPINTRPQFSVPLLIFQWIVPVFLAYQAFKGRFYRFGFFGNWATKMIKGLGFNF